MKPLSDFFPRIATHVVGCPEPLMAQALLDSAIAFCEDSLVQRETLDAVSTVLGVAAYELDTPSQQSVARVLSISVDGTPLHPLVAGEIPQDRVVTGKPTSFYTTRQGSTFELRLFPTPDTAYEMVAQVALRPKRSATQLEDDLYELWIEPVVAGAVSRITAVPNQPFSDPAKSASAAIIAAHGSSRARNEGEFGRVRGSLSMRVKPRRFV